MSASAIYVRLTSSNSAPIIRLTQIPHYDILPLWLQIPFFAHISLDGLGYLKILAPPEKILRWIEGKLNLLGRLPHYVSIDQKTYGRYGVLPTSSVPGAGEGQVPTYLGSTQRLGP